MNGPANLTTHDVAARLGVHVRTVQRMCRNQEITHHRIRGRDIRFTEANVAEYLAACEQRPRVRVDAEVPNPHYEPYNVVVPMRPSRKAS